MANADGNTQTRPEITPQQPAFADSIATLLKKPQGAAMDLFQVLDICQQYVDGLIENDNHTECMALCGRLLAGLEVLKSLLKAPLPDHLIEQLTLKDSETSDYRAPLSIDSETLREYCVALTIALLNNQDLPDQREQMIGMLYELLFVLADDLKAPRFVRVAGRLQMIEGEPVAGVH
ncbi:hypothetical protein MUA01_15210 [Enterobacteriaceae bacterium H18W14]|uniref:hypothetical protein n=1 Tax=Dryocola boscaweniae TaxID=2925397 RepID=UPI0022F0CCB3|nr:hypothetical protein [Dryocola boscaweniae]MCT4716310.1 hypothetical protein [Dryocola boscaweniae]